MPTYMVSYDLKTPDKDYSAFIQALQEGYRSYWHCLGSTWLIVADQNHTQVRDYLVQHIDNKDQLIVADLGGNAAWHDSRWQTWRAAGVVYSNPLPQATGMTTHWTDTNPMRADDATLSA
jgi:hypothetical protein